jgi:hypothetical protein
LGWTHFEPTEISFCCSRTTTSRWLPSREGH